MADADHTDALATLHDAGATRVPPWLALVSALASVRPGSIGETIDWLTAHRDELEHAYESGRTGPLRLAEVPRDMQYEPDLGYMDRTARVHYIRGRSLFKDLTKRSFYQSAIFAMTGLDLRERDCELLDYLGTVNLLVDRHVWPMAATRRVAARGGGYSAAVVTGLAMMCSPMLAGEAAAGCARFLQRARAEAEAGGSVKAFVERILRDGERVMGFGRPVVGPDERVPFMADALERHGRLDLPFVTLLREVDQAFCAAKGLRSTSAAWAAAALCDYGMNPEQVLAVSNYWVAVCVYSQALYSGERSVVRD
ncbi:MAG: citrate/2-methylcitrate synthase [Kofleriaceae bacterium]|nr:citrate/2-methylcitrate synthase [Kofleriaceae bacterium]